MHFRWSFIFSTYGMYFLPGSNFAPFEEVKVPVSNSTEFFQKSATWRILEDLGVVEFYDYNLIIILLLLMVGVDDKPNDKNCFPWKENINLYKTINKIINNEIIMIILCK